MNGVYAYMGRIPPTAYEHSHWHSVHVHTNGSTDTLDKWKHRQVEEAQTLLTSGSTDTQVEAQTHKWRKHRQVEEAQTHLTSGSTDTQVAAQTHLSA